ncbi:Protein FAR1-RELATED SEQUENCE 5 [Bienertia sinuspersici]
MVKEYVGGYENIGPSKQDFKTFKGTLKTYIEGSDTQMFVDNFKKKKLLCSAFLILTLMKKVAYVELYGQTQYTGFIDNEDTISFEWLFKSFLKGMGQKEPLCLITDQDPAMKIVIGNVFEKIEHRFCMWHIMKKMPDKINRTILQETKFLEKMFMCVEPRN